MGLCKCPKRKVTTQFCYEHRVNVCEHCVVINHPKCVVQSYLLWLQDSDYSSLCALCKRSLLEQDCTRLSCYHVFHWKCLVSLVEELPETTAPAGYKCPSCDGNILPKGNSPVEDALREKLSTVNWGRLGLGLPLLTDDAPQTLEKSSFLSTGPANGFQDAIDSTGRGILASKADFIESQGSTRKYSHRNTRFNSEDELDLADEVKFRRRSSYTLFGWNIPLRQFQKYSLIVGPRGVRKKCFILLLLAFLIFITLSVLVNLPPHDDATFDVHNNPNVRVNKF